MAAKDVDQRLALFLAHREELVTQAGRILGSRAWAEDVVQEAYLRFAPTDHARTDADGVLKPQAYLSRIVRNLATDWLRHLSQERQQDVGDEQLESVTTSTPTPEEIARSRDQLRIVAEALSELPPRTQRAFEMNRINGQTLVEITRELGISVTLAHQLVKSAQLHCARRIRLKLPSPERARERRGGSI